MLCNSSVLPTEGSDTSLTLDPIQHSSFGCLVNYHLAHGRLTHIQRLFGVEACSTPVLNRTQQV